MMTPDVEEAVLLSDRIVMMTNGPAATIGDILHVDPKRARKRLTPTDETKYNHYRSDVLNFLYYRDRHPSDKDDRRQAESSAAGKPPEPAGLRVVSGS